MNWKRGSLVTVEDGIWLHSQCGKEFSPKLSLNISQKLNIKSTDYRIENVFSKMFGFFSSVRTPIMKFISNGIYVFGLCV